MITHVTAVLVCDAVPVQPVALPVKPSVTFDEPVGAVKLAYVLLSANDASAADTMFFRSDFMAVM